MKKLLLLLLILPVMASAQRGMLSTIAGIPLRPDTLGDGGPATSAHLQTPNDITFDNNGNLLVATLSTIRKISTSGIITRIAGSHYPRTMGYVIDGNASTSDAMVTNQILIDRIGNIFFTESSAVRRIRKIDTSGIVTSLTGLLPGVARDSSTATSISVTNPSIALDRNGNLIFHDEATHCIFRIEPTGIIRNIAGRQDSSIPCGYTGDGGPATNALLGCTVSALCTDRNGNIYLFDNGSRVRKVDTNGIITTIAGTGVRGYSGDGGPASAAQISGFLNKSMVFDQSSGDLYLSDPYNYVIRKIDKFGIISTVAGTGSRGRFVYAADGTDPLMAQLVDVDMCVDSNHNLYILDGTHSIRKIEMAQIRCDSFQTYLTKVCSGIQLRVNTASARSGNYIISYFGDGGKDSTAVTSTLVSINHDYSFSGTYTLKQYLCNSGIKIDSVSSTFNHNRCTTFDLNIYHEDSFNCNKSRTESLIGQPSLVQVDSNGVIIDTISCVGRLKYYENGRPGDVYKYKIIEMPRGVYPYCPATAIFKDSIQPTVFRTPTMMQAMRCDSSTAVNLSTRLIINGTGSHAQNGVIYASNSACNSSSGTLTLYHDPRYALYYSTDTPISTGTGFIRWSIPNLSMTDGRPYSIAYHLETTGGVRLLPGTTVRSKAVLSTTAVDADTTDNVVERIDTSKSSYDPNEVLVTPQCLDNGILAQKLEYTIHFENTGNDTAFNIFVMDTLPSFVEPKSMRIIMSSHDMAVSHLRDAAGRHVVKFDFPRINLLDTSHHGVCDAGLIYTINTKPGLAMGTQIANRAGIYFDDNEVVLTNYAITTIGCTLGTEEVLMGKKMHIYPNPANQSINIVSKEDKLDLITIFDIRGKVIHTCTMPTETNTVDISQLPSGLYSVKAIGKQGVYMGKFTKL